MIPIDPIAKQAAVKRRKAWNDRMWRNHRLRPVDPAILPCVRMVAGETCPGWGPFEDEYEPCLCVQHHRCLDHARLWRDEHNALVLTAEPYSLEGEAFTRLMLEAIALGLTIWLEGRSPYYPGYSLLLRIERPRTP